jgi:hypothetical protein
MIFSALVIVACLAIAYMWSARGFFSALIHLLCTIVAGAIAFAAWEPMTYWLMGAGGDWLVDASWSLGLAVPFAVSLIVLRLATNAILPKNVDLDAVTNLVGGGVCGLLSGIITTGVFALSLGYMRMETEIMGYRPLTFSANGSLVRTGGLLFPTDRLTASFYSVMSDSTFRTEENLAKWRPDMADEGPLLRTNFDGGKSRHTHRPDSFEVVGRFTVDAPNLFNDTFNPPERRHTFTYPDGRQAVEANSVIEGFVVRFRPAAAEKSGQVVVGNGQVRLVAITPEGTSIAVQPLAVNSRADDPTPQFARWRYEGQEPFIATVRGDNESPMGFEFVVPKGSQPIGLYVKGIRADVRAMKGPTFNSIVARDNWVKGGGMRSGVAAVVATGGVTRKASQLGNNLIIADNIPGNYRLQRDDLGGLNIDDQKRITDGENIFSLDRIRKSAGAERTLIVDKIFTPDDQVIVQVIVDSRNREWGLLSDVAAGVEMSAGPVLVDENGIAYTPIGYAYETATELKLKISPSSPITRLDQMPILTRSKPDQRLTLLFRVGRDQKIKSFSVGEKGLLIIDPPFSTAR